MDNLNNENNQYNSKGTKSGGYQPGFDIDGNYDGYIKTTVRTDDGGVYNDDYILNVKALHTTPKAISRVLDEAIYEISQKIQAGNFDPQSLELINEWINKISEMAEIQAKYEAVDSQRFIVSKRARLLALEEVTKQRMERVKIINERFVKQNQELENRADKIDKKKFEQINAKLDEQLRNAKDKILRDYEHENLKNAHEDRIFRRDLLQKDMMDQQKRAHAQMEMDFKHSEDQKNWEKQQKDAEEKYEEESRAVKAEYAARIAEAERKLAEELKAASEAKMDAYDEEMHALRFKRAVDAAKAEGRNEAFSDYEDVENEVFNMKNDARDKAKKIIKDAESKAKQSELEVQEQLDGLYKETNKNNEKKKSRFSFFGKRRQKKEKVESSNAENSKSKDFEPQEDKPNVDIFDFEKEKNTWKNQKDIEPTLKKLNEQNSQLLSLMEWYRNNGDFASAESVKTTLLKTNEENSEYCKKCQDSFDEFLKDKNVKPSEDKPKKSEVSKKEKQVKPKASDKSNKSKPKASNKSNSKKENNNKKSSTKKSKSTATNDK